MQFTITWKINKQKKMVQGKELKLLKEFMLALVLINFVTSCVPANCRFHTVSMELGKLIEAG